ncbi:50S ribosomal protein L24 [Legionella waltersii]|uniref:Large ribosomal subunit protein uL24 n=1 Tax=Legionella waltersii TaxID=66969 RepID=A0A0W1A281_9GAMM|nr:50S ribosomal protein L24 [Legionella waltersii]KTD75453.1 50S ribosomal protein L24 [Legionella waltersii]SNU98036.1 50S ribosomal protein L24 [Legionella waltersii]
MKRIRTGDDVIIIAGKSKGHRGKVLRVIDEKVVVEGGNLIKKHMKPNPHKPENKGGIISREAPIHVSNVAHFNPITKKADKVGFKLIDSNGVSTKVRYYKSNNEIIDRV